MTSTKSSPLGATDKIGRTIEDQSILLLWNKVVEMGQDGDMNAAKFVLERLIPPPRKSPPVQIELPPIDTIEDVFSAHKFIISQMASGKISPEEAKHMTDIVSTHRESIFKLNYADKADEFRALLEQRNGRNMDMEGEFDYITEED